jgi:hypothetical protein
MNPIIDAAVKKAPIEACAGRIPMREKASLFGLSEAGSEPGKNPLNR